MESANKMRIPFTIWGFHLQFADSTYKLRIPRTVADSATAQFNDTNVLSFVFGFPKLFWIPQILLRFPRIRLFRSNFDRYKYLCICLCIPKHHIRSKKSSNVADSAKNLILACCGFRLQGRECTVWPRNDFLFDYHEKIAAEHFWQKIWKCVKCILSGLIGICKFLHIFSLKKGIVFGNSSYK